MEIPLEISVELGRTRRRIRDILRLGKGSVLRLSRLEGEPVDLFVNETLIARGEVIVAEGKYRIRIVEIVDAKERMKSF